MDGIRADVPWQILQVVKHLKQWCGSCLSREYTAEKVERKQAILIPLSLMLLMWLVVVVVVVVVLVVGAAVVVVVDVVVIVVSCCGCCFPL